MRVLISAVGHRTEHWTDLVEVLCARGDVEPHLVLADVTQSTVDALTAVRERYPVLGFTVRGHRLGEDRTGHMASVLFRSARPDPVARLRPDVVHVIGEAAYLSTAQVLRWRRRYWPGTPVSLYAAQNVVMRFPPPFPYLERRAYAAVDHALPITPAALAVLRAKGYRGPATIVPLGVDTHRFQPRPGSAPARFTVGFVGRLEPHKGIAELVRAAELIDADLVVIGRGSLSGLVEQAARRRPGRVHRHDWTDHDELPRRLAGLHVLALPSVEVVQRNVLPWVGIALREQFGRVLVEAMACGVPVVGSEVGEIPYVLGGAGLTCPPADAGALAARLAQLRDDPDLAGRLRAAGAHRVATEFSWERVAARLTDVWRGLTRSAVPNPRRVVRHDRTR